MLIEPLFNQVGPVEIPWPHFQGKSGQDSRFQDEKLQQIKNRKRFVIQLFS